METTTESLPRNLVKRRERIDKAKQEILKLKALRDVKDQELKKAMEEAKEYRPTNNATPIRPDRLPLFKAQLAHLEAALQIIPDTLEYQAALNILAREKKAAADKRLHEVEAELAEEYGLEVRNLGGIRLQASRRWTRAYVASVGTPGQVTVPVDDPNLIERQIATCKQRIKGECERQKKFKAEQKKTPPPPPQQLLNYQKDQERRGRFSGNPQSLL